MSTVESLAWPLARTTECVAALARASGLATRDVELPRSTDIERVAAWLGIEAEPIDNAYHETERALRGMAPAIVRLPQGACVALLGGAGKHALVVAPDLAVRRLPIAALVRALVAPIEEPHRAQTDRILDDAKVHPSRRERVRAAVLAKRLAAARVAGCFLLRRPPGASFRAQVLGAGVASRVAGVALAHVVRYGLMLLGWWMVGRGALEGRLDRGWLLAWALVLFTQVPFAALVTWLQGTVSIDLAAVIKQRAVAGALQLAPEEVRNAGAGELLGRVIEADAVEQLALNAGMAGLASVLEIVVAGAVLSLGAAGALEVVLLVAWIAITLAIAWRFYRDRARWAQTRIAMTHDLVERMVGHRTRVAQQAPERWHDGEDEAVDRYLEASKRMDARAAMLEALVPRGWLVLAVAVLAPSFVFGDASPAALAVTLGGALLAFRALKRMVLGVSSLAGAGVAWGFIGPIFRAASRAEPPPPPDLPLDAPQAPGRPILDANELVFRYRDRGDPVLRGCSVSVAPGDRLLLEGSSGGGKSTLGAVLAGLREPESGLLLLNGLDRKTLGLEGWRKRIVAAPQFHENHVLASTFAFNLLMGRAWPPSQADLELATSICDELDLAPLLARMPAGLQQMVGETGWQLSHGERSRLYIARALLQRADLLVLDESFAALDPVTLRKSLECVLARANALVVIAHP